MVMYKIDRGVQKSFSRTGFYVKICNLCVIFWYSHKLSNFLDINTLTPSKVTDFTFQSSVDCRMEMNAPHPWSAQRWFLEIIQLELVKGWPEADEDLLWAMGSDVGLKKWKKMSADDKKRFFQCEDLDKKKESEKKPTPKKGKKVKRDPNKPKQGMTSFFHFMNGNRERIKAANPDFSITEVSKAGFYVEKCSATQHPPFLYFTPFGPCIAYFLMSKNTNL